MIEATRNEEREQDAVGKTAHPSRGKRYSPAIKKEILGFAQEKNVASAAVKYGVTETTLYEWRKAAKRRGSETGNFPPAPAAEDDSRAQRDRRILAMWRQHPGYGPSQLRNMLKRGGFKVSVGTVRQVIEEHGYLPPTLKRKEHGGRYEAGRPRELYHLDFYHFFIHKQKQCVLFIEDDYSRFIAGWAMVPTEQADAVIESFDQAVQRYGRPEGVMSDRGSAFHSWKGLSRFEALLEEYEVNYYLAKEAAVNGKVEALNASFQKECVEQTEFMDVTDAARSIGRWVEHYNHRRTHHGLGGLLVPADRYYGVVEQTLKRIEQGLGAETPELTNSDSRGLELFRVVSHGGKPQIWLMGQKILG
jgi:transposase InsO family protein